MDVMDLVKNQDTDADAWATAFTDQYCRPHRGYVFKDEHDARETMQGWFANAMMVMHDKVHSLYENGQGSLDRFSESVDRNSPIKLNAENFTYKENDYQVIGIVSMKCPATGEWLLSVLYRSEDGKTFTRELNDFVNKFEPMGEP